jgi:hypothetical protein
MHRGDGQWMPRFSGARVRLQTLGTCGVGRWDNQTMRRLAPLALVATIGWLVSAGLGIAACGSPPTPSAVESLISTPLLAARSWFQSINDKNLTAAEDHFVPAARDMMDWGGGDTSTWSTFTDLHCRTLSDNRGRATVLCNFVESASSSEGNPDSFWTVSLQRQAPGIWLINNYGQG